MPSSRGWVHKQVGRECGGRRGGSCFSQLVAEGEVGVSPEGAGVPEVPHVVAVVLVPEESSAATRSS